MRPRHHYLGGLSAPTNTQPMPPHGMCSRMGLMHFPRYFASWLSKTNDVVYVIRGVWY
jgi:hypothetical protein